MEPTSLPPVEKLKQNIRYLCERIRRGQAAERNPSIKWQLALRVISILLSSLGSVGVIADKAASNLPGQSGWAFWGSVILLVVGIAMQIANEFQIAQRAADSKSLYERCNIFLTQLQNCLIFPDPRPAVAQMLVNLNQMIEEEKYNRVLPAMTDELEASSVALATDLFDRYNSAWNLPIRPQRVLKASSPNTVPPTPTVQPSGPGQNPNGNGVNP